MDSPQKKRTMEELESLVLAWSRDRGLLQSTTAEKQCLKALEEFGEVAEALIKGDLDEAKIGSDIQACVQGAYGKIRNRTGKTVDGTFIKDDE